MVRSAFPWHEAEFRLLLKRTGTLPHALLLRGPKGIGKLVFAEALAGALLCESPDAAGGGCGKCIACGWMEQGSHPDMRRLEPESVAVDDDGEGGGERKASRQISVDQVRGIADFVNVSSHRGGAKVVLVHPAETLNVNAANALLKNLEEPPARMHFLLVAHRWHQLIPTIKSRCQHIALPLPAAAAALEWLRQQGLEDPARALAHAGGAPLQAAAFDEEFWRQRERFMKAITEPGFDALRAAEQLRETAPALAVGWLQKWSFDLAHQSIAGSARYNTDFAEAVARDAARLDLLETLRFHRHVIRLQRIVAHPLNPRLFLEQLLLAYAELTQGRFHGQAA